MDPAEAWSATPQGWKAVPDGVVRHAKEQALTALRSAGANPVGPRLARYYDRHGNYAGSSFAELFPNHPDELTATDLHAVSLLSVDIGPGATRRLLDVGPARSEVLAALAAVPRVELQVAGPEVLESISALYRSVKRILGEPTAATSDRWVTASKLCARKRPYLFPVRDRVVRDWLGLTKYADHQIDLLVFRSLVGDREVVAACDAAVSAAHQEARAQRLDQYRDRRLAVDRDVLRVLDAALWTVGKTTNVAD